MQKKRQKAKKKAKAEKVADMQKIAAEELKKTLMNGQHQSGRDKKEVEMESILAENRIIPIALEIQCSECIYNTIKRSKIEEEMTEYQPKREIRMFECGNVKEEKECEGELKGSFGILALVLRYWDVLFRLLHLLDWSQVGIVRNILCLSEESFTLSAEIEFLWAVEHLLNIPSCPIILTNNKDGWSNGTGAWLDRGALVLMGHAGMDLVQKGENESTAVLQHDLKEAVFRLEYKISAKYFRSSVAIGCVHPDLCPWPQKKLDQNFGFCHGSASLRSSIDNAQVHAGKSASDNLGDIFVIHSMDRVVVEVDLRGREGINDVEKKGRREVKGEGTKGGIWRKPRTMAFAVNNKTTPAYVTGLPEKVFFAV